MLALLLKYWQVVAGAIIGVVLTAIPSYAIHRFLSGRAEARYNESLIEMRGAILEECEKAQKITEDASHEYQNQIADLDRQLAAAKRVRPHSCITVHSTDAANGHHGTAGNAKLPDTNAGVDRDALLDFGYDAEKVGLQLDSCQSFVKKERE